MMFEAGYKGDFILGDFNYEIDTLTNPGSSIPIWNKNHETSNDFKSTQNVNAIYATFAHTIENFSYMAGLRIEHSHVISNLVTLDSIIPNNYVNFYPTLHLVQKVGKKNEIQLNYSRRVNRPDIDDLKSISRIYRSTESTCR